MSQVTASPASPPLTVECSRVLTTTITLVPSAVDLPTLDQHDVVLPPQLIPRDTVRGSVYLVTVPQQKQPQSQMPSQAFANNALCPS